MLLARSGHPRVNQDATLEDLRKEQFINLHRRRAIEDQPSPIREFLRLELPEAVRVSELLEIPTVVASTDLLGIFAQSMAPLMEQRLGLQIIPIPLEQPAGPIYMIWHGTRRNDAAHRWLRELVETNLNR